MQDIENDMDDLFKKAVANYTLQNGESNWDTIVPQLSGGRVVNVQIARTKNIGAAAFLLALLLLIPISTVMFSYFYAGGMANKRDDNAALSHKQNQDKNDNVKTSIAKQNGIAYLAAKPRNIQTQKIDLQDIETYKDALVNIPSGLIKNREHASINPIDSMSSGNDSTSSPASNEAMKNNQQQKDDKALLLIKPNISATKKPRFYAGFIAGITLNEVKKQGFKKPGFDIGIITGYNINKKIAVEAGLMYSKKYYFSDGKYFSMDKMHGLMPDEMKIMNLDGSSNVYQLPVAVKYKIAQKNASAFFTSAGISSYILIKEKNNYKTTANGLEQNMKGMYKNVSVGFASSVDVSIGYEHTIQKNAAIRIQPYLQIPLKGMGMGNMQVMSTGIHIAYTR